jgi:hypothetical protein
MKKKSDSDSTKNANNNNYTTMVVEGPTHLHIKDTITHHFMDGTTEEKMTCNLEALLKE